MSPLINNVDDLKAEIARLKEIEKLQSEAIKDRFSSLGAIFATVYSLFPSGKGNGKHNPLHPDFVSLISRFVLPLTLNKTLFKNSGFLVKTLVGLLSQKASGYINEPAVASVWDKVSSFFKKKDKVKGHYPYSL